jgi:hypothetical protein
MWHWLFWKALLTLNIPRGGPLRTPEGDFCDPAVTLSTNLLMIFVCVSHQLKINKVFFKKKVKKSITPLGSHRDRTWHTTLQMRNVVILVICRF